MMWMGLIELSALHDKRYYCQECCQWWRVQYKGLSGPTGSLFLGFSLSLEGRATNDVQEG